LPIFDASMTPVVPIAPVENAIRVGPPVLGYEARKGGKRLMLLEGFAEPDGQITVDAEVWSARPDGRTEPVRSSYRFATAALAARFVEEAMVSLEYLGCDVADLVGET